MSSTRLSPCNYYVLNLFLIFTFLSIALLNYAFICSLIIILRPWCGWWVDGCVLCWQWILDGLMTRYPIERSLLINLWIVFFLTRGLVPIYKWNSVEFFVELRELENLETMSLSWVLDSHFSNGLWYLYALRVLDWISRNWDLFKDTGRLSHVDLWVRAWHNSFILSYCDLTCHET